MIKKLSFVIAIIGIAFLVGLLLVEGEEIRDIKELEINSKIVLNGVIKSERDIGDFKLIKLEGIEIDVICSCERSYLDEEVVVEGIVNEFNEKKQIKVLRIKVES